MFFGWNENWKLKKIYFFCLGCLQQHLHLVHLVFFALCISLKNFLPPQINKHYSIYGFHLLICCSWIRHSFLFFLFIHSTNVDVNNDLNSWRKNLILSISHFIANVFEWNSWKFFAFQWWFYSSFFFKKKSIKKLLLFRYILLIEWMSEGESEWRDSGWNGQVSGTISVSFCLNILFINLFDNFLSFLISCLFIVSSFFLSVYLSWTVSVKKRGR